MVDGALGIPQLGVDETRMARVRRLAAARRRDWIVRKGQSRCLGAGQLPPLNQDPGLGLLSSQLYLWLRRIPVGPLQHSKCTSRNERRPVKKSPRHEG
jgi:hypothetical protein